MTARTEDRPGDRPPGRNPALLWTLLALLAVCFAVNDLLAVKALPASRAWQPLGVLAINLVMVGAIWVLSKLKPSILKAAMLFLVLGTVAFAGFSVAATILKVMVATKTLSWPWSWRTIVMFTSNLLIGAGAIWGIFWLKPWDGWRAWTGAGEPVSPATRRANRLFGLKELLGLVAMVALFFGAFGKDHPLAIFSNSPVPVWIAIVAIASWLVARVLREWWQHRSDEHERQASDFGRRVGAGVFLAVTPAWWVAARAGLLPQPDAMILFIGVWMITSFAWSWRRSH